MGAGAANRNLALASPLVNATPGQSTLLQLLLALCGPLNTGVVPVPVPPLPRAMQAFYRLLSTAIENGALSAIENGTLRSGVTDP